MYIPGATILTLLLSSTMLSMFLYSHVFIFFILPCTSILFCHSLPLSVIFIYSDV